MSSQERSEGSFRDLVGIMDRLRGENGCPWDREQTLETLLPCMEGELEEIADAVRTGDAENLCEELGDLLFVLVFAARIAKERGWFTMEDVVAGIRDKIVRRHPHVFGEVTELTTEEALDQWDRIKEREKRERRNSAPRSEE